MGESAACLVRSFSQLSPTSAEEKKENSIQRALTASVSFGRFMSESLDWERWSAFTNNRHLEEIEKYSKPGSVAEKKAYFEAHFKRRRAAALLEQQNAAACTISEAANTEDKIDENPSLKTDHAQRASYVVTDNMKQTEIQSSNLVVPAGHDSSVERTLADTKPGGTEKAIKPLVLVGVPLEIPNHLDDDVSISDMASKIVDNASNKDDSAIRNSASGEKAPEVSSAKMLTKGGIPKCPPFVKPIVPVLKNSDKTPESKRNSMESSNKRRSYTRSLHMSINFPSCSGAVQKDMSSGLPKTENSRVTRAPAKRYKNSTLPQTSKRASVNDMIKHFSVAPSAEIRRAVKPHSESISSEAKTSDEKVQSPFSNYSKSSNLSGNKARQPTVPSSFTFKSEERAVKRREFFQMLEQKAKLKEKHQPHAKPQVTGRSNDKDVGNSLALDTSKGTEAPLRNITKKIPTARPFFPKIEERAAAFKVQDSNITRPPWRLSVKTEGTKDFTGKNSRPPKKIMNENASPNIQL